MRPTVFLGSVRALANWYAFSDLAQSRDRKALAASTPESFQYFALGFQSGFRSKELAFWSDLLPRMINLTHLTVGGVVNQQVFEVICRIPRLEYLNFEARSTGISDLSPIRGLQRLSHFQLVSSPKLMSIDPLGKVSTLRAVGITGSMKSVRDLEALAELEALRGLYLIGSETKVQVYDSLSPLGRLRDLIYLVIGGIKTRDESLEALTHCKKLQFLTLDGRMHWPVEEYKKLRAAQPTLQSLALDMACTGRSLHARIREELLRPQRQS